MAPPSKKRKTAASFELASRIAVVAPACGNITSFCRVSKSATLSQNSKGLKADGFSSSDANILRELSNGLEKVHGQKRKPENDLRTPAKILKTTQAGRVPTVQLAQENQIPTITKVRSSTPEPTSLRGVHKGRNLTLREPDTPTRSTRKTLEAFTLTSSPASSQTKAATLFPSTSSPPLPTPCPKKRQREEELPEAVQSLIDLHTAFLSVLSLHYAHNGTATPVDLRQIAPGIGKAWRRHNPTSDDIRRIVAIQQRSVEDREQAALLSVWAYGKNKTCIEYCEPSEGKAWGRTRQPLNAQSLKMAFSTYLRAQYLLSEAEGLTVVDLIDSLPLARLHKRATSKTQKSMILPKGQTRISELKHGAIQAQKRNDNTAKDCPVVINNASIGKTQPAAAAPLRPSQRGDSLLNRIRAKESLLASQPAGPTQEQLDRRSALHKVPEVVNVLSLLANNTSSFTSGPGQGAAAMNSRQSRSSEDELAAMLGMGRPNSSNRGMQAMFGGALARNVSMSMQQAVQRTMQSMRSPMAASEVERVIRLLASEICPEWIQLRELGSVRGVTIRESQPVGWKEKVDEMIKKW